MYLTPSLDRSGVQTRRSMARVPDNGYSDHHELSALVFYFIYKGWLRSVQAWRGESVHPSPRTCSERRPRPHQCSCEHGGTLLTKTE